MAQEMRSNFLHDSICIQVQDSNVSKVNTLLMKEEKLGVEDFQKLVEDQVGEEQFSISLFSIYSSFLEIDIPSQFIFKSLCML